MTTQNERKEQLIKQLKAEPGLLINGDLRDNTVSDLEALIKSIEKSKRYAESISRKRDTIAK